jgi:hypothetical protein
MINSSPSMQDLSKVRTQALQEICDKTRLTEDQVTPLIEQYESRLGNLAAQYTAGASKAAAKLQQQVELLVKKQKESSNGLGQ